MSGRGSTGAGVRLYEKAQRHILELIESRDYGGGERIPSERALAHSLGVHRMTVRKAVDRLVDTGILERRGTSGTYIPEPVIRRPIGGRSFSHGISEIVRRCGGAAGSRLLMFERAVAGSSLAERMQLPKGTELIAIRRLRTVNALPFCLEMTWVPAARVPSLAADDLVEDGSLYALFKARYGIEPGACARVISVAPVAERDGDLLGMRRYEPALLIRCLTRDVGGAPIEYLKSVNHPQRVVFTSDDVEPADRLPIVASSAVREMTP